MAVRSPMSRAAHDLSTSAEKDRLRLACGLGHRERVVRGKMTIGRSPGRGAMVAIGLTFVGLEVPSLFEPLPGYARNDTFELVMFYAVPAIIVAFGLGLAWFGLRSGVFVDDQGLLIRHYAGGSKRVPLEEIRAISVDIYQRSIIRSVTPVLLAVRGEPVPVKALAHYDTSRGRRRAAADAGRISRLVDRPYVESDETVSR